MSRVLLAAVWAITLAVVVGFGALLYQLAGSSVPLESSVVDVPDRSGSGTDAWRVVKHLSAHHVAVIDVETGRPQDARRIAVALVQGLEPGYAEVLIYFHRPGRRTALPARRVQWSPATGFTEAVYE